MTAQTWGCERRKTIVCLDSYEKGVPKGRIYSRYQEAEAFDSLSQFLIKMEALLDDAQLPQSYTATRSFSELSEPLESKTPMLQVRKGRKATFEVQVIFRQHTSWQGVIVWLERNQEHSFRSVLELILLMDSALREVKGSDTA